MKEPYEKTIPSGLSSLQNEVGGMIQVVYPFEDPVGLICNDEGKINGMELNRALRTEEGEIYDIVAGTFLVAGLTEDNFGSLRLSSWRPIPSCIRSLRFLPRLAERLSQFRYPLRKSRCRKTPSPSIS
jgi:hypothetical protein